MQVPWALILKIVLGVVGWLMDRSKIDDQLKEAFIDFLDKWNNSSNDSVKQHKDVKDQKKELNKK